LKTNDKSIHLKKGVVVFLDALGTKTAWTRKNPIEFINSWEKVVDDFKKSASNHNEFAEKMEKNLHHTFLHPKLDVLAFSDTIIISYCNSADKEKYNPLTSIMEVGYFLLQPFFKSIINHNIFLRGVISYVEFYLSESQYSIIGPAVEEVGEWYEQPEWFGVSTTPSATYALELALELSQVKLQDAFKLCFMPCETPLKDNTKLKSYAVLWPLEYSKYIFSLIDNKKFYYKRKLKRTRKMLLESFISNNVINKNVSLKYKNTLQFYDEIERYFNEYYKIK
jgi:hypothetical protein